MNWNPRFVTFESLWNVTISPDSIDSNRFPACSALQARAKSLEPDDCPASELKKKGKEMLYLMTHSTHFIYVYMASVIWRRTYVKGPFR